MYNYTVLKIIEQKYVVPVTALWLNILLSKLLNESPDSWTVGIEIDYAAGQLESSSHWLIELTGSNQFS